MQQSLELLWLYGQRRVVEPGHALKLAATEFAPCRLRVGWRDLEQKAEAVADVRQSPVDIPDGLYHCSATEGVVMPRLGVRPGLREREEGLLQRAANSPFQRAQNLGKELGRLVVAVDGSNLDANRRAGKPRRVAVLDDIGQTGRMCWSRRIHLHGGGLPRQADPLKAVAKPGKCSLGNVRGSGGDDKVGLQFGWLNVILVSGGSYVSVGADHTSTTRNAPYCCAIASAMLVIK